MDTLFAPYINNKKVMSLKSASIVLLISVIIIPQPVSAYLDPGFGSLVWQMLAAIAFGIAFTLKIYWMKIKNFLSKTKSE